MSLPTHVIDPDGEVTIVLLDADSSFAELSEDMIAHGYVRPVPDSDEEIGYPKRHVEVPKEGKRRKLRTPSIEEPVVVEELIHIDEPVPSEETVPPEERIPAEEAIAEWPVEQPVETGAVSKSFDGNCFKIQVSAKHLMFASPVFRKLLTGGWKEGTTYLEKRSVDITAKDWDIEALLIFLRVIHGQQYQIPQKLTLEMLAKVAVLVDYYECREAMYIWTTTWIDALEKELPKTFTRDILLWLWISWFFQLPARFKETTSIVMSWSNGSISNLGLPIPDQVIGEGR